MSQLDAETVHTNLIDVDLPSSLADIKNPTEDYILNLVTEFLNIFGIDLSAIRRPTFEQLSTLALAEDNPEILTLINISEAMANIGNSIFLKDFYLTDITSPVPKRTRRLAKFLFNFVLYAKNKMVDIEELLESTRIKVQELNELRERKNIVMEANNAKALENSKKLAIKEQLLMEIEQMKAKKEGRKSRIAELEAKLKAAEKEKLKVAQHHGKLTAEAVKMRKMTQDLESKVVRSPTRYEASLREVMEQKKMQIEKREQMQEKIRSNKPAIEKIESYLSIVRQEHAKFPEVTEAFKCFTDAKQASEEAKKKVTEMRSIIEQEAMMYTQENEQASNTVLEKAKEQCEQSLSNIRKEHTELLTEKKVLEKKLEDSVSREQEILSQRDQIRASTEQRDDEYKAFVKNCQELYDAEIKQEREIRKMWNENEQNDLSR